VVLLRTGNQLLVRTDVAVAPDESVPPDYFITTVNIWQFHHTACVSIITRKTMHV